MKRKAYYWFVDCGDEQEFRSLAALRCYYSHLSLEEKRNVLGSSVIVIRTDYSTELVGYMDFRGNYPHPTKVWIRKEPPENW